MRLLAVADLHGAQYRLNILLNHVSKYQPDLVVICGDLTQFGPGEVAMGFLDQIPVDAFAVPGNIDTPDVVEALQRRKDGNLHLQRVVRNDISFVGIGGLLPSKLSDVLIQDNNGKKPLGEVIDASTVLVTHVPPYRTQDAVFLGQHAGSKELRELVDRCQPRLVLCGHIHEDPGVTYSESTVVVNCSMGKRTEGALIDLDGELSIDFIE